MKNLIKLTKISLLTLLISSSLIHAYEPSITLFSPVDNTVTTKEKILIKGI